jgi:hypothetical protein
MTIENGADQAANDAALTTDQNTDDQGQNQTTDQAGAEDQAPELDDEGNPVVKDETEELEWDGKKWVLPKDVTSALKPALLRQQDYTRKTQEVAEARKALEAEREQFKGQTEAQQAHFKAATKLAALDEQIEPYAKMTPQDWQNLRAQDPNAYQDHWVNYDFLKNQRDAAARDFSQKEMERRQSTERESANRIQKAEAEIARHVEGWTPGNELDKKISDFGISRGYSPQELAQLALQQPKLVRDLNRLRILEEAAAKQNKQQSFQKSQEAKPVSRVGGSGGSAARKTTDASGDALSTEEWAKREQERVAKQRQALGRR